MAKHESYLQGDFDEILDTIHNEILNGSISASYEDSSSYTNGNFKCMVRVYERYSTLGSNRVSLTVTLIGQDKNFFLSAITSGGSQAIFFKLNTFGEESFLDKLIDAIQKYKVD